MATSITQTCIGGCSPTASQPQTPAGGRAQTVCVILSPVSEAPAHQNCTNARVGARVGMWHRTPS